MRFTWLGHSGVLLEAGGLRIAADPLLRPRIGPLLRSVPVVDPGPVDVVLISHLHHDHCDLPSLRSLNAPLVIGPPGSSAWLAAHGVSGAIELAPGARKDLSEAVSVQAVPADHPGRREPRGPRATAVGHVVESGSGSVWLAGDTGLFDGMTELPPVDLAAIPVWGWGPNLGPGHLNPAQASEAVSRAGARVAVPVHWGTLYPVGLKRLMRHHLVTPGPEFAALSPAARVLAPGGSLTVTPAAAPPARPLTDGSIVVRQRKEEDMQLLAAASHDPETQRWLDDPPMSAEQARTGVRRAEEAWRSGRAIPLTIADARSDEAVGQINLQYRPDGSVALAYSVFPAFRGQGIAPRAVLLVADWALTDLGLTELLLEADESNAASVRVAEKAGFHPVATTGTTLVFSRRSP